MGNYQDSCGIRNLIAFNFVSKKITIINDDNTSSSGNNAGGFGGGE